MPNELFKLPIDQKTAIRNELSEEWCNESQNHHSNLQEILKCNWRKFWLLDKTSHRFIRFSLQVQALNIMGYATRMLMKKNTNVDVDNKQNQSPLSPKFEIRLEYLPKTVNGALHNETDPHQNSSNSGHRPCWSLCQWSAYIHFPPSQITYNQVLRTTPKL